MLWRSGTVSSRRAELLIRARGDPGSGPGSACPGHAEGLSLLEPELFHLLSQGFWSHRERAQQPVGSCSAGGSFSLARWPPALCLPCSQTEAWRSWVLRGCELLLLGTRSLPAHRQRPCSPALRTVVRPKEVQPKGPRWAAGPLPFRRQHAVGAPSLLYHLEGVGCDGPEQLRPLGEGVAHLFYGRVIFSLQGSVLAVLGKVDTVR